MVTPRSQQGGLARRFIIGQTATLVGNWVQVVGLSILTLDATGSPGWTGLVLSLRQLPLLVMGPVGRRLGDGPRPARVGAIAQGASAIAVAPLLLSERPHLALLIGVGLALGILNGLDNPARLAVGIHVWPPESDRSVVAVQNLVSVVARLVGPLLGAVLIAVSGTRATIWLNVVSFLVASGCFAQIDRRLGAVRHVRAGERSSTGRMLKSADPLDVGLLLGLVLFCLNLQTVLLVLTRNELGGSDRSYAVALGFVGLGGLIGAVAGARSGRSRPRVLTAAFVVVSGALLASSVVESVGAAIPLLTALGGAAAFAVSLLGSDFEARTRRSGSIGAVTLYALLITGVSPIAAQLGGVLAELTSPRMTLRLCAVAVALCAAASVLRAAPEPVGPDAVDSVEAA